ncbi:hypothetical protein TKK_0007393 [Trichogramma kaykai]
MSTVSLKLLLLPLLLITACILPPSQSRAMVGECKEIWVKKCMEHCKSPKFLCLHMVNFPDQPYCNCSILLYK